MRGRMRLIAGLLIAGLALAGLLGSAISGSAQSADVTGGDASSKAEPGQMDKPLIAARLAARVADANGSRSGSSAVVHTTWYDAQQVIFRVAEPAKATSEPDRDAYAVTMTGDFVLQSLGVPPGAERPTGKAITVVFDGTTGYELGMTMDPSPPDLSRLGPITTVSKEDASGPLPETGP